MSVSLQKGQKVSLSKENAGLSQVIAGLGWDEEKDYLHRSHSQSTVMRPHCCFAMENLWTKQISFISGI